jgi:hypothetical protein
MKKYITPTIIVMLGLVIFYLATRDTLFQQKYLNA